jgi:hypothetical protein
MIGNSTQIAGAAPWQEPHPAEVKSAEPITHKQYTSNWIFIIDLLRELGIKWVELRGEPCQRSAK